MSLCGALALLPFSASAQRAAPAAPAMAAVPWFEFGAAVPTPAAPRARAQTATLDLRMGEDETITVYGRKKAPEFNTRREDLGAPRYSEAAVPYGLPMGSPTSCNGAAYRTIGGQPATGEDLVGMAGIGAGRC